MSFAYAQKIKYKKNLMGSDAMMFGIGHDCPETTPSEDLRYDACITYDDTSVKPEGEIGLKSIESGKCLCYLHKGRGLVKFKSQKGILKHGYTEQKQVLKGYAHFRT